jgi:DNA-directed RNA polymerase specialized sigma24 family protein
LAATARVEPADSSIPAGSSAPVAGGEVAEGDQDTLVRALAVARSFRVGGDLRAWLFSIMHNALRIVARR